ncbi:hypothetical protein FHW12_000305 [Dokdonella fugitiva]|uniref:Uncharacterized protein n=1 Tax=Dokdonella fugitiva TaxID=328517 RepID=A0A839F1C1_9GAMM|nr:hypothetical protein [Dokdonella fugitiva]MBA8886114.1 hypothetical protein [Dokdonella fugitiva]
MADVASQNELVDLVGRGMKVEDAAVARALQDAANAAPPAGYEHSFGKSE